MFIKENTITTNNILKCNLCKLKYSIDPENHNIPMSLPCGFTVCQLCIIKLEKKAKDKQFKCILCDSEHTVPNDGFSLNILVNKFVMLKSRGQLPGRGKDTEMLKINLRNIEIQAKELKYQGKDGIEKIRQHYEEQKRQVQLTTERKIKEVTKVNDELIQKVNDYEKKCIQAFLDRPAALTNETIN